MIILSNYKLNITTLLKCNMYNCVKVHLSLCKGLWLNRPKSLNNVLDGLFKYINKKHAHSFTQWGQTQNH